MSFNVSATDDNKIRIEDNGLIFETKPTIVTGKGFIYERTMNGKSEINT